MIPVLETERLLMRAPRAEDFDAYAAFYASERSRPVGGPLSRTDAWRAFAFNLGHWHLRGYGRWGVEEKASGAWIGHIGLWYPEGWLANEIAWTIGPPEHEGKGFAREAALAARDYARRVVGWTEAFSVIDPQNERSVALARRLGCTPVRRESWREHILDIWRHPAPEAA